MTVSVGDRRHGHSRRNHDGPHYGEVGQLRRLAQPYFLPLTAGGIGALVALSLGLIALVAAALYGVLWAVCTGLHALTDAETASRLLPGLRERLSAAASAGLPGVAIALACCGAGVFAHFRTVLYASGCWRAWAMLGVIAAGLAAINGVNVTISYMARDVENALVGYDQPSFKAALFVYALCLITALPVRTIQRYATPRLSLMWRHWLSARLTRAYMRGKSYYYLSLQQAQNYAPAKSTEATAGTLIDEPVVASSNDTSRAFASVAAATTADAASASASASAAAVDNPDQRIADDTGTFCHTTLSFGVELLYALMNFSSFSTVLWSVSPRLMVALMAYAAVGSVCITLASRRLVRLNAAKLTAQADFRYGLVRARENAESIAFYGGEAREQRQLLAFLDRTTATSASLLWWSSLVSAGQTAYGYAARFLPWAILTHLYFEKLLDFGAFSQASMAFGQILGSVSFLVDNVGSLASYRAGVTRLLDLQSRLDDDEGEKGCEGKGVGEREGEREEGEKEGKSDSLALAKIKIRKSVLSSVRKPDLSVGTGSDMSETEAREELPDSAGEKFMLQCIGLSVGIPCSTASINSAPGSHFTQRHDRRIRILTTNLDLDVSPGTKLLITGPSGCGKTSLLRTLCGLWRPAAGQLHMATGVRLMFLPQRPYMLLGTLREQLCYPGSPEGVSDARLKAILELVKLPRLAADADVVLDDKHTDWGRTMSLGEQQRVAFARLLLARPSLVILDEATSALDEATEAHLYSLLDLKTQYHPGANKGVITAGGGRGGGGLGGGGGTKKTKSSDDGCGKIAFVSVGHRSSLVPLHAQTLRLQADGGWTLSLHE